MTFNKNKRGKKQQSTPPQLKHRIITKTTTQKRVSLWCNGKNAGLRNRSKCIRTPVALLCSLSDKYPWERHEPPYPPCLNSLTVVFLEGWLSH